GNPAMTPQLYLHSFDSGNTRLVSRNMNGEPAALGLAEARPVINGAGTRIVFDYSGSDLIAGDLNEASDVFLYEVAEDTLSIVSRARPELPFLTNPSGVGSELNSITADGSKLTFTAADIPSFPGDTNRQRDVFVADLATGRIDLVSTGDPYTHSRGGEAQLSGNGRFALYLRQVLSADQSLLGNLRFFRRDLVAGVAEEVDAAA